MSVHIGFILSVPEEHADVLEAAAASRGMTLREYSELVLVKHAFAVREQFATQVVTNRLNKAAATLPKAFRV